MSRTPGAWKTSSSSTPGPSRRSASGAGLDPATTWSRSRAAMSTCRAATRFTARSGSSSSLPTRSSSRSTRPGSRTRSRADEREAFDGARVDRRRALSAGRPGRSHRGSVHGSRCRSPGRHGEDPRRRRVRRAPPLGSRGWARADRRRSRGRPLGRAGPGCPRAAATGQPSTGGGPSLRRCRLPLRAGDVRSVRHPLLWLWSGAASAWGRLRSPGISRDCSPRTGRWSWWRWDAGAARSRRRRSPPSLEDLLELRGGSDAALDYLEDAALRRRHHRVPPLRRRSRGSLSSRTSRREPGGGGAPADLVIFEGSGTSVPPMPSRPRPRRRSCAGSGARRGFLGAYRTLISDLVL